MQESNHRTHINQTNKTNLLSQDNEPLIDQEMYDQDMDNNQDVSEEEDQEIDYCDDIPVLQERISQLKQKLVLYKQAILNMQT